MGNATAKAEVVDDAAEVTAVGKGTWGNGDTTEVGAVTLIPVLSRGEDGDGAPTGVAWERCTSMLTSLAIPVVPSPAMLKSGTGGNGDVDRRRGASGDSGMYTVVLVVDGAVSPSMVLTAKVLVVVVVAVAVIPVMGVIHLLITTGDAGRSSSPSSTTIGAVFIMGTLGVSCGCVMWSKVPGTVCCRGAMGNGSTMGESRRSCLVTWCSGGSGGGGESEETSTMV